MTENRWVKILGRVVDVRRGEIRLLLLFSAYFFLITLPAYIIKPVRVSLLLSDHDPSRFAYAYLLSAVLMGFAGSLNADLLNRLPRRRCLSGSLVFFTAGLIVFRILLEFHWPILSMLYWFWGDLFIVTLVTQFWIGVNDFFFPHQAKRLVGFMVGGGLLGGFIGALAASHLAPVIGTVNLLLVCPVVLLGTLAVVRTIYPRAFPEPRLDKGGEARGMKVAFSDGLRLVRGDRYLRNLAALMAVGVLIGTLIDFQFNTIVQEFFPLEDVRTSFLGIFLAGLMALSFVGNLALTSRFLRRFGIAAALLTAPVLLMSASLAVILIPASALLFWACFARGTEKALDSTLSQSAREILYMPVPPVIRAKAKIFIDMFIVRSATGAAAVLILVFFSGLHISVRQVGWLAAVLAIGWIFQARAAASGYLDAVTGDLKRKWQDGRRLVEEKVDVNATRLVFDTLQSRDRSRDLFAMNIFDLYRRNRLGPDVKKLLFQEPEGCRIRSMDAILDAGDRCAFPDFEEALSDESLNSEIEEILGLESYRSLMTEYLDKVTNEKSPEIARMEAAKIAGMMAPGPETIEVIGRLLEDDSSEVLNYALAGAARLGRPELLPRMIGHLENPMVCRAAQEALKTFGPSAVPFLGERLQRPDTPVAVKKSLPDVLAGIGNREAADVLMSALAAQAEAYQEDIIHALHEIRLRDGSIPFSRERVMEEILKQLRRTFREYLKEYHESGNEADPDLRPRIRLIFELLSLIFPAEDIVKAYQNILKGTKKSTDFSLEMLDGILPQDLKKSLFVLIEDLAPEERLRILRRLSRTMDRGGIAT
ncbi:MAG: MFS transporter [Acidobacteriota bacterium]|nr:MFS transporter [Acidobacteriota bacterium]